VSYLKAFLNSVFFYVCAYVVVVVVVVVVVAAAVVVSFYIWLSINFYVANQGR